MIERLEPMTGGRATEIDMIEREMEGGVVVIQSPDVHDAHVQERLRGLGRIDEVADIREWGIRPLGAPKG